MIFNNIFIKNTIDTQIILTKIFCFKLKLIYLFNMKMNKIKNNI